MIYYKKRYYFREQVHILFCTLYSKNFKNFLIILFNTTFYKQEDHFQ